MATILETVVFSIARVPSIHKAGYPYIIISFILGIFAILLSPLISILCFLFTIFFSVFFRNPSRISLLREDVYLAPADGLITHISRGPGPIPGDPAIYLKVSIFLSIFNVHINRSPCSGVIEIIDHKSGEFISTISNTSGERNERNIVKIKSGCSYIYVVQIAGLIARRICFFKKVGSVLFPGEHIGLIKFGSRTELYLPESCTLMVQKGQTTLGGETIIGIVNPFFLSNSYPTSQKTTL
jgi:phosphatidylserine decarboxylase